MTGADHVDYETHETPKIHGLQCEACDTLQYY